MGQSLGSFSFAPPEQIGKAKTADHRADIYACATLIYQALSGQLPYAARNLLVMVEMKCKTDARRLSEAVPVPVDRRLEAFLARGSRAIRASASRRPWTRSRHGGRSIPPRLGGRDLGSPPPHLAAMPSAPPVYAARSRAPGERRARRGRGAAKSPAPWCRRSPSPSWECPSRCCCWSWSCRSSNYCWTSCQCSNRCWTSYRCSTCCCWSSSCQSPRPHRCPRPCRRRQGGRIRRPHIRRPGRESRPAREGWVQVVPLCTNTYAAPWVTLPPTWCSSAPTIAVPPLNDTEPPNDRPPSCRSP